MSISTIAVTQDVFRKSKPVFCSTSEFNCIQAPEREADLAELISSSGARHAIVGVETYTDGLYHALPSGGVLARFGVGHDMIDKRKATECGILCTNTPFCLDDSVAEYTMALLLAAARRLAGMAGDLLNDRWEAKMGTELRGKRLAVIGCGPIGCKVARIAAFGFGMSVTGCSRSIAEKSGSVEYSAFDLLTDDFQVAVREADFVSLHIPATEKNRKFIDRQRLSVLPSKAWLINTARGSVVDESALFDALESGRIAGAALDVFDVEPYTPSNGRDLRTLPNVLLTPHAASSTNEACGRMASRALENISAAEHGRFEDMDLLNLEVLGRWSSVPG